ncbi:hypothetical protein EC957_010175 [Mortierella hygrophila]|uniref:Uncharacterized protein n=1 Tax=Mortierella hygrophila TaxID=979708 RepID=A0A9P6EWR9_9FUNG|nr:hypothetical protein EC957_010175 [Mortierella hygrophila]
MPVDFINDAASSPHTESSMPVDTTSNVAMILITINESSNERITLASYSNRASPNEPIIPDNHTGSTPSSDPTTPNNHSGDATNHGTQPGSPRRTSIPTFSSDPSNLPLDYDFTDTVFETSDHALQAIYAFANTHFFPIHRARTNVDLDQYDRPRIEILCPCSGTKDHVTRKNNKRRTNNGTVNTSRRKLKWEKTECPWKIYIVPDATIPKWRVSTYGTNGAYQHNHDVGTPYMRKHINRCPDINTLMASRIDTTTNDPLLKRPRLQSPARDPSFTLDDLFKYIKTACHDQPSAQSRIIQSTYDHVRGLLRTSNK